MYIGHLGHLFPPPPQKKKMSNTTDDFHKVTTVVTQDETGSTMGCVKSMEEIDCRQGCSDFQMNQMSSDADNKVR